MGTVTHPLPDAASRRPSPAQGAPRAGGIIGPNSILQLVDVLRTALGDATAERLLKRATGRTFDHLPTAMIDEREPNRLVREVIGAVGAEDARRYLRDAGTRTGDYLLAHRIPRVAQWVMRLLPRAHGRRLLLGAMARHAWTFAGSGTFRIVPGTLPTLEIAGCPMCHGFRVGAPMCDYYAATFERLLQVIIDPQVVVREVACEAVGDAACRFVLSA
ncbi:MAG: bacteriochlorophyll 4-vinyl reductase [Gemmatimonadetes bacterium]|nr:bacteriochlorophyll 4-vinyl reductase [Gemmatimonadota bacterium]